MNTAKTLNVPEAGRLYFDLGRNASYEAAKRGQIPVIKIGGRLRVPVIAMERMLEAAAAPASSADIASPKFRGGGIMAPNSGARADAWADEVE